MIPWRPGAGTLPIAFLLSIAGAAAAPASGSTPTLPAHPRDLVFPAIPFELPRAEAYRAAIGGSTAFVVVDPALPLVSVTVALPRGSAWDPPAQPGLGEITAAALRRAGAGSLGPAAFDLTADRLGVEIDAVGSATRSGARLSVPAWNLEAGLDLLFDLLVRPSFDDQGLAALLANLEEGMERRNQRPRVLLDREWTHRLYEPGELARAITPATLEGLDARTLRAHHSRVWRPEGAVWAIAGDLDRDQLLRSLEERVAAWSREVSTLSVGDEASTHPGEPPARTPAGTPGLYHLEAPLTQALVAFGHRLAPPPDWLDPDRAHLDLTAELLGGRGAISRLAGRLRSAEGLVYAAGASVDAGRDRPGEIRFDFSTTPGQTARAIAIALEEVERLREAPPADWEVEAARQNLLAEMMLSWDTPAEVAGRFAEDALLSRPHEHSRRWRDALLAAAPATVRDTARRWIDPRRFVFVVVGPWSEIGGSAAAGESSIERVTGSRVVHLDPRDPRTLEPQPVAKR